MYFLRFLITKQRYVRKHLHANYNVVINSLAVYRGKGAKPCRFDDSTHTSSFDRLRMRFSMSGCCFWWETKEVEFPQFQLGVA